MMCFADMPLSWNEDAVMILQFCFGFFVAK